MIVDHNGVVVGSGAGAGVLELPGFVNAHSHAFQRALRGRVETRSAAHPNDSFWAWRTTMYRDAARLTVDDVRALATWCYADMLKAGYTTVGEFHYLHHDVGAAPFAEPAMSLALAEAAQAVGIRLVVLETAYGRGGVDKELTAEQQRFSFATVEAFWSHVDKSRALLAPLGASVGVAIHSVRACSRQWIAEIAMLALENALPLHAHACEQQKELDECRFEHGKSPIALLADNGFFENRPTIVHGTHVSDEDIEVIAANAAFVCLTPSTERNLGDGLCPIASLADKHVALCVGSDSHARIDVVDELRSLEDHERLRLERRNVLTQPGGRLAQALVPAGTWNGAQSLFLGALANDRVVVPMPIEGAVDAAVGLDAWLVGGSSRDVQDVDVAGVAVVRDGKLVKADDDAIRRSAIEVLTKLR